MKIWENKLKLKHCYRVELGDWKGFVLQGPFTDHSLQFEQCVFKRDKDCAGEIFILNILGQNGKD